MPGTRKTQPFRSSAERAPSQILDVMRAGKSKAAPGAALLHASNQAKAKPRAKRKLMIPRY
jgi:hypothetical protein